MKKILLPFLLLLSSHVYALDLIDRIVAVVNEDIIMLSELRREAHELYTQLSGRKVNPMPTQDRILSRALDRLILHKLQLAEAEKKGIDVDQETVTRAMTAIAQSNNLSLIRFRDVLAEEGVSYNQLQNHLKETLIIRRLISQEVNNRIQISKAEINQELSRQEKHLYESVNLQHILVRIPEAANDEEIKQARNKALRARAKVDQGESFQTVAQNISDSQDGLDGGNLGWIPPQELPVTFIENIRGAQVNELIGPFRSSRGYHVIKVLGYKGKENHTENVLTQQTQVRHILIRTDEMTSDNDAKERLMQLRGRLIRGEDFSSLARSHSSDQASAIKGGDLGWVNHENLTPVFAQKMDDTAVNAISEPFKTRFGWHILQVLDRRDYDQSEENQRLSARKAIQERKAREAKEHYLRKLRAEAYIDIRAEK